MFKGEYAYNGMEKKEREAKEMHKSGKRILTVLVVMVFMLPLVGFAQEIPAVQYGEPQTFDFSNGMPAGFGYADGWTNGNMFNVTWRGKNVQPKEGWVELILDRDAKPTGGIPYAGAELRSHGHYGFGRYEVSMKAIKNDGVVSSFFTYTGPSENNPWDEIDFEILGRDTTKVQLNYFTNGRGNHEYMYDLGFDASEDFHTYAFEWHEDRIEWYVDGVLIHTATKDIPKTPGKIMANVWCGKGVDGWLKPFRDDGLPVAAAYAWITYTPFQ